MARLENSLKTDQSEILLKELVGCRVIAYHPVLAKIMESASGGVWLSQLLYWARISKKEWFYKAASEIAGETGLTKWETQAAKARAIKLGIIQCEVKGMPRVSYYCIEWDALRHNISTMLDTKPFDQLKDTCNQLNDITQLVEGSYEQIRPQITIDYNIEEEVVVDEVYGELCTFFEENIHILSPYIGEQLKSALEEYPMAWIKDAIKIAADQNKRRWAYMQGILKRWKEEGRNAKSKPVLPELSDE